jgi:flavin reductase (DIM6/NTAB) family NADH-FMN oxidoreductase RutF
VTRDAARGTVDAGLFRSCLRRVPAQVGVVSTRHEGVRNALTATAISSLSAEPPQILVCMHHLTRVATLVQQAGVFAVNFLSLQQKAVAQQCAISGLDAEDRFAAGDWQDGEAAGVPLLAGASVNLECELSSAARHGTHFVLVGLVLAARFSNAAPLLYHDGAYSELGGHGTPAHWDSSILGF